MPRASAAFSRGRRGRGARLPRHGRSRACWRCSRRPTVSPEPLRVARSSSACNHEQQHQELILTDIKHVFSVQPAAPGLSRAASRSRGVSVPRARLDRDSTRAARDRPRRATASPSTTSAPPPRLPRPLRARRSAGHQRRVPGVHGATAATRAPSSGSPTAGPRVETRALGRAALLGRATTTRWTSTRSPACARCDPAEPVCHVSYYEADAFARWAGARLPTEAGVGGARRAASRCEGNFVEIGRLHPAPAERAPGVRLHQLFGDVWEWTAEPYSPYPGYRRGRRRARRIQRQVHVQPARAARRLLRHAADHIRGELPQLLPARGALAVHRHPPGAATCSYAFGRTAGSMNSSST